MKSGSINMQRARGRSVGAGRAAPRQGGVGFWVPSFFGSFAASPLQPGWSLATVYYHTSVEASGRIAAAKQIEIERLRPTARASLDVNLSGQGDLVFVIPSYVFDKKIFDGQFAVSMVAGYGRNSASLDGTLTASAGPLSMTRQGSISEAVTGFADLLPQASLRWNFGVHNVMIYGTTNIRVGSYDATRRRACRDDSSPSTMVRTTR